VVILTCRPTSEHGGIDSNKFSDFSDFSHSERRTCPKQFKDCYGIAVVNFDIRQGKGLPSHASQSVQGSSSSGRSFRHRCHRIHRLFEHRQLQDARYGHVQLGQEETSGQFVGGVQSKQSACATI
jgi:hypothetical protein